jgi:HD-like signal output (HDOD) protein
MYLDDLLDSQVALPAIPRNIAMVLSELSRDEPDLRKVSQYIHTDIGLTTLLLGLANSAQFQLKNRIGNVSDALAVLGLVQVRSLTAAAAMAGAFKHVRGLDVQQFWRYSLNVAKLSRKLARLGVANASIAFTAGLVHAAGELVMHLGMPDQVRWLNERVEPLDIRHAHAERHLLGYFYADVGAGFAKSWEFPQSIVDAIAHHFHPLTTRSMSPLRGWFTCLRGVPAPVRPSSSPANWQTGFRTAWRLRWAST